MNGRPLLVSIALMSVMFAGCAESPTDEGPEEPQLEANKGAIAGLLVDDRYRPIPDATILLQELGLTATTNANGEFNFKDIAAGTYTLRVTAEGHEAAPSKVVVEVGKWSEPSLIARRTFSIDGSTVTQEYVVFMDCVVSAVLALPFDCSTDLSGDGQRSGFEADYTEFGANATALVMEMKAEKPGRFEVDIWWPFGDLDEDAPFYANDVFTGDYAKFILKHGETNTDAQAIYTNDPWLNDYPLYTEILVFGEGSEETGQVDPFFGAGAGAHIAVKAKFLHTLFLGEPEEDVDTYCVLCE